MKKEKLNLRDLTVTSFVTSLPKDDQLTYKGGVTNCCGPSFNQCATIPVNNCNVASYNAACPSVPVTNCDPLEPQPTRMPFSNLCIQQFSL